MKKAVLFALMQIVPMILLAQNNRNPEKFGIEVDFGTPNGLIVDEESPNFEAKDSKGNIINLYEELKKGPAVLIFYRGEWCPVCNKYLSNFQDSLSYIEATGAKVFAITPETTIYAEKTIKKTRATFTVIPDVDEEIMKNFKVLFTVTEAYEKKIKVFLRADIAEQNGQDDSRLPVPATYIINTERIIVYKQFDSEYHNRATVKEILDHIPSK